MKFKGYTLNPFQVKAAKALTSNKNVLVSAPTGAGKTLVAEYAIDQALRSRRKVIYTSPIKALSNQKYRDFKADGIRVGLMTGDLTLDPDAPIVIMTTEIFRNSVFEDPERFNDLDFVIFDEIHFIDDKDRGTVWEESLIFAPDHIRFVGLSATISNLAQFGNWIERIRHHELEVIHYSQRPVPLKHSLVHVNSGFFQIAQRRRAIDKMRREQTRVRQQERRGKRGRYQRESGRRRRTPRYAQLSTGMVLEHLQENHLTPVLFFCFSRKECEIKAQHNKHRRLLGKRKRHEIEDLFDHLCDTFELDPDRDGDLRDIRGRAVCGIGYHHAGMLPIHKEVVERLFTSGLLQLLFTTETFALGINMPARTVVFDSLRKFDGVSFDYMKARDYMQMAGRAGRQGIDDEGLVLSILDDEDLEDAPLADLFGGKVEPIVSKFNLSYSTILNLYEHLGGRLMEAYDRSFAAFQAESGSQKKRERIRSRERAALRARIHVLIEAGYLDKDELLPRGRLARRINGYEVQVTELFFSGVLDQMDMHQLAATFTALVHEERRRDNPSPSGKHVLRSLEHKIEKAVRRFISLESNAGFQQTVKPPNFAICAAADAWSRGASIDKVERLAGQDGGDVVRTMRMAVQMMRQLRRALGRDYPLSNRLAEAGVSLNRDVVDAKRQFELG
jgi:superfamily II RNA helicase